MPVRSVNVVATTGVFVMILFAGCVDEPSPGPEPPTHPFAAAFGFGLEPLVNGTVPQVGEWVFVEVEATPAGALAAFRLPVPPEAVRRESYEGREILMAGMDIIPLLLENETDIDLWGMIQGNDAASCPQGLSERFCTMGPSLIRHTRYEGSPREAPEEWERKDKPHFDPMAWGSLLSKDHVRPFVLMARSETADSLGLLMRFRDPPDPDPEQFELPKKPRLEEVNGTVWHLAPDALSSGVTYAYYRGHTGAGTMTRDLRTELDQRASLLGDTEVLRMSSATDSPSGWGFTEGTYGGERLDQWQVGGTLRGAAVEDGGMVIQAGRSFEATAEGDAPSEIAFTMDLAIGGTPKHVSYQHFDIGFTRDRWT